MASVGKAVEWSGYWAKSKVKERFGEGSPVEDLGIVHGFGGDWAAIFFWTALCSAALLPFLKGFAGWVRWIGNLGIREGPFGFGREGTLVGEEMGWAWGCGGF